MGGCSWGPTPGEFLPRKAGAAPGKPPKAADQDSAGGVAGGWLPVRGGPRGVSWSMWNRSPVRRPCPRPGPPWSRSSMLPVKNTQVLDKDGARCVTVLTKEVQITSITDCTKPSYFNALHHKKYKIFVFMWLSFIIFFFHKQNRMRSKEKGR